MVAEGMCAWSVAEELGRRAGQRRGGEGILNGNRGQVAQTEVWEVGSLPWEADNDRYSP